MAEWWLKSQRVTKVLRGETPSFESSARLEVPAAIYEWKASSDGRKDAEALQTRNRDAFEHAFARGLSVLGFERDEQGNGAFLLGRWDEDLDYGVTEE